MTRNKLMNTMLVESSPVTGSEWAFSSVGTVVGAVTSGTTVVVGVVVVLAKMFDATESPIALTALMVTE